MDIPTFHEPIKTVRGRVVYHRKKHNFRYRDLYRIRSRLENYPFGVEKVWKLLVEIQIMSGINDLTSSEAQNGLSEAIANLQQTARDLRGSDFDGFSGGEFGGGGADRDFRWPWENPFEV